MILEHFNGTFQAINYLKYFDNLKYVDVRNKKKNLYKKNSNKCIFLI